MCLRRFVVFDEIVFMKDILQKGYFKNLTESLRLTF